MLNRLRCGNEYFILCQTQIQNHMHWKFDSPVFHDKFTEDSTPERFEFGLFMPLEIGKSSISHLLKSNDFLHHAATLIKIDGVCIESVIMVKPSFFCCKWFIAIANETFGHTHRQQSRLR